MKNKSSDNQLTWSIPVKPLDLNKNIDPEWEVTITKVENGYMMTYKEDISDSENPNRYKITREVFEDDCGKEFISEWDNIDKKELNSNDIAMHNLLQAIKEYFGHNFNKHRKVNLMIKFEKENDNE